MPLNPNELRKLEELRRQQRRNHDAHVPSPEPPSPPDEEWKSPEKSDDSGKRGYTRIDYRIK